MLYFDNDCLRFLEAPQVLARVRTACRMNGLTLCVSEINVLEALKTSNFGKRQRLLGILAQVWDGGDILPLPEAILSLEGRSPEDGAAAIAKAGRACEYLLENPTRATDVASEIARKTLGVPNDSFEEGLASAREPVRAHIRGNNREGAWKDGAQFLDEVWSTAANLTDHIRVIWLALQLPGTPNIEDVLKNRAWRIYLECLGIAAWERNFLKEQPRPAHLFDLRQLVYLSAEGKSVFVTNDRAAARAGKIVIEGRYPDAAVKHWGEYSESLSD